jgi:hypothetical protein
MDGIAWGEPLTDPDPARRDPRFDAFEMAFTPLPVLVACLARQGAPPGTVAHLTEAVIRQRASANAHERAAIYQYVRAQR